MSIALQITNASYWEHLKYAKELAGYLDLKHPKRVIAEKELNKIIERLKKLKCE